VPDSSPDNDPLRELLVDASKVDRQAIADALKERIAIDPGSGRLVLLPGYQALDARRKVLAILLARKAAVLLEVVDTEAVANKAIAELSGLAPGTAAPSVRSLKELRLVDQDADRAYFIPNARLLDAIRFVTVGGTP
jgi:hypothetical protein